MKHTMDEKPRTFVKFAERGTMCSREYTFFSNINSLRMCTIVCVGVVVKHKHTLFNGRVCVLRECSCVLKHIKKNKRRVIIN